MYVQGFFSSSLHSFRSHRSFLISPFRIYAFLVSVSALEIFRYFSSSSIHSFLVYFGLILVTCFTHTHGQTSVVGVGISMVAPGTMQWRPVCVRGCVSEHFGYGEGADRCVMDAAGMQHAHILRNLYANIKRNRFKRLKFTSSEPKPIILFHSPTARVLRIQKMLRRRRMRWDAVVM